MVEMIVAATTVAVIGLTALNTVHAGLVAGRLVRHTARRHSHLGLGLWLPTFGAVADLRNWLRTWRSLLSSGDPAVVAIRLDARLVVTRYLYVALTSQTWAMAVTTIAPNLA